MATSSLKNINLLSKAQYDAQANPATDELWALDIDTDTDLKNKIVGWCMPDYSAGISLTGISSPYIAPANGIIYIERNIGDLKINGNAYVGVSEQVYSSYSNTIIINKGDSLSWTKNSPYVGIFYPFKGVN